MKRVSIILLSLFYLVLATGISINFHYCGNKLKNIAILGTNAKKDCCKSKKMKMGCCKEKTFVIYKVNDGYQDTRTVFSSQLFEQVTFVPSFEYTQILNPARSLLLFPDFHTSPYRSSSPIYILNRTFRV